MEALTLKKAIENFNKWGAKGSPFFFVVPSDTSDPILAETDLSGHSGLYIKWLGKRISNFPDIRQEFRTYSELITIHPPSFGEFLTKFNACMAEIKYGNTYLINLTFPIQIEIDHLPEELMLYSTAPYTIYVPDKFICFSPEPFIHINPSYMATFPMKGTLDAEVPDGANVLRHDPKELAEHYTIVDLLRNDLGMISPRVWVERFAYIDQIETHKGRILQMSSEIRAITPESYPRNLGDLLFKILPAGSVTGAPKKRTVDIIRKVEGYNRGYYTGISGYFDGQNLTSCVNIRYIEMDGEKYYFKTGMGLTFQSDPEKEYAEVLQKVYLPFSGKPKTI
jgi:para-aminobenzoate synthetase component 1